MEHQEELDLVAELQENGIDTSTYFSRELTKVGDLVTNINSRTFQPRCLVLSVDHENNQFFNGIEVCNSEDYMLIQRHGG